MSNTLASRPHAAAPQRGSAIIMGLILLIVITLLSLGGVRGITIQERMASNLHDRNLAFQAAETALRAAEADLRAGTATAAPAVPHPADEDFWNDCWEHGGEGCPPLTMVSDIDEDWNLAEPPGYRIERLRVSNFGSKASDEAIGNAPLNRITARGVGGTEDSVVILQATFVP